jgi:hypothetical protein
MADANPTGDGAPVALSIPPGEMSFLRSTFTMARDGIREELATFGDRIPDPGPHLRQLAAYCRLLRGLSTLSLVPDREICELLAHLLEVVDSSNEYRRVVAEHVALARLLAQIGATGVAR